jgi:hypothetical protein
MRCGRVRRLLPLYVGGDLGARDARAVFDHVRACADCAALDAAFDSSRSLLGEFSPPDFDEEFYAGIRRAVHAEIETKRERRHTALAALFGRRRRFALAALAAVLVSSVTLTALRRESRLLDDRPTIESAAAPETAEADTVLGGASSNAPVDQEQVAPHTPRAVRPTVRVKRAAPRPSQPLVALADECEPAMQKIEIQTADPNIRIIWFAPSVPAGGD